MEGDCVTSADEIFSDAQMMINLLPRIIILKEICTLELDYQIRKRKGETGIWEEEESKKRDMAAKKIQDSLTDQEKEWVATHKEIIKDVLSNENPKKKETRGRPRKNKGDTE